MSWQALRNDVHNCAFTDCRRNWCGEKFPILFLRKPETLHKIRVVVVSQEPATSLQKKGDTSKEVEDYLIDECKRCGGILPRAIGKIIRQCFDPTEDKIYWTHALKCIPHLSDKQIGAEWKQCAPECAKHLKREQSLIPSRTECIPNDE